MRPSPLRKVCIPLLAALFFVGVGSAAKGQELLPDQVYTATTAFDAYIAEKGEDLDACFEEFPELRDQALGLNMQASEGEQPSPAVRQRRVVIALDASGSMAGRVGGQSKMDAARDAAAQFLSDLPEDVEVGLVVFGHMGDNTEAGRAQSCAGVELTHAVQAEGREAISDALEKVEATGWTPLASAITAAGGSFSPSEVPGEQVVYVVSDGEETCDGDPVEAARLLSQSEIRAVVNIIGFDLPAADRAQLRAVAEAGGGIFLEAADARQLRSRLSDVVGTTLKNRGAMARTSLNTKGGQARNALATSGMLARTGLCLSGATAREHLGLTRWVRENGVDVETTRDLRDMLATRAERYQALYETVKAEAERRRENADAVLEQDLERATDALEAVEGQ